MIKDKGMPEIKDKKNGNVCQQNAKPLLHTERGAVPQNLFTFSVNRSRSELQAFDRRRGHRLDL